MKEKISVERPRPFAAGYMIPFYAAASGRTKKPWTVSLETSQVELLRDHRRLAFHTHGLGAVGKGGETDAAEGKGAEGKGGETDAGDAIDTLDAFAAETLVQKNAVWFKNDLSEETIRGMLRPSKNPEGFFLCRFSPDHFPKVFRLNDTPVADWEDAEKRWFKNPEATVERVVAELVCHGIYLKKQGAELLWKLQGLSVYTYEPAALAEETNIDEHKEDIENDWAAHLDAYTERMEDEIRRMEARIQEKRRHREALADVLAKCRRLSTADPEWNASIEYLRRALRGKMI